MKGLSLSEPHFPDRYLRDVSICREMAARAKAKEKKAKAHIIIAIVLIQRLI